MLVLAIRNVRVSTVSKASVTVRVVYDVGCFRICLPRSLSQPLIEDVVYQPTLLYYII